MKRINRQSSRAQNQTSPWKWRENIKKHNLNTYAEKRTTEKRDAVPWSFVRLREYSLQWTFKSTSFKEPYQHLNFFPYYSLDFAEPLSHPDSPHIFLLTSTKLVSALQPEVVSTFGTFPYWFFFSVCSLQHLQVWHVRQPFGPWFWCFCWRHQQSSFWPEDW